MDPLPQCSSKECGTSFEVCGVCSERMLNPPPKDPEAWSELAQNIVLLVKTLNSKPQYDFPRGSSTSQISPRACWVGMTSRLAKAMIEKLRLPMRQALL